MDSCPPVAGQLSAGLVVAFLPWASSPRLLRFRSPMDSNKAQLRWQRLQQLWAAAQDLEPARRGEWLEEACQDDLQLWAEVEALLAAEEPADGHLRGIVDRFVAEMDSGQPDTLASPDGGFSGTAVAAEAGARQPTAGQRRTRARLGQVQHTAPAEQLEPGQRLAYVRIEGSLGQGGMGQVYAAVDERLGRQVALKVLRTEHSFQRNMVDQLLREARILSQLRHPSICQIYDLVGEGGLVGLVLELVPGRRLAELLAEGAADLGQALRWGLQISEALAVAHGAGIVHRDLKPGNVMITPEGQVKVLDFGIARLLQNSAEESSARSTAAAETEDPAAGGQPIGEQAAAPQTRLAKASSASPPLETLGLDWVGTPRYMSPEQLKAQEVTPAADLFSLGLLLYEMVSGEPARSKETTLEQLLDGDGNVEPARLEKADRRLLPLLRGLTATEPGSRPSAFETASRIRWLLDAPRRRRRRFLASAAIAALVLFAISMAWQARRVALEAERANAEAERASNETARARLEATKAQSITDFLIGLFDVGDPWEATAGVTQHGAQATAVDILDSGIRRLQQGQPGQQALQEEPEVRVSIMLAVSKVSLSLSLLERARNMAEQALAESLESFGPQHLEVAKCRSLLGTVYYFEGRYEEAVEAYEQSIGALRTGVSQDDLSIALHNFGSILESLARHEEAEAAHREGHRRRVKHSGLSSWATAMSGVKLASFLVTKARLEESADDLEEASSLVEASLSVLRRERTSAHPDLAYALSLASDLASEAGDHLRAEKLERESLEVHILTLGEAHPTTVETRERVARTLMRQERNEEALALFVEVVEDIQAHGGPDHPRLCSALQSLGTLNLRLGRAQEAEQIQRRSLDVSRRVYGAEHWRTRAAHLLLAEAFVPQGRFVEAEGLLRKALAGEAGQLPLLRRRGKRVLDALAAARGEPPAADLAVLVGELEDAA